MPDTHGQGRCAAGPQSSGSLPGPSRRWPAHELLLHPVQGLGAELLYPAHAIIIQQGHVLHVSQAVLLQPMICTAQPCGLDWAPFCAMGFELKSQLYLDGAGCQLGPRQPRPGAAHEAFW